MKKIYYFLSILALPLSLVLISYSSGSPGGRTGSPGDGGATCINCHSGGSVTTQDGWITTDVPMGEYIPGETYTITATGTHSGVGKFGFELTAENTSGQKVGDLVLVNTSETRFTGGSQDAITHTSAGTTPTGDSKSWSVEWTAPENDEGDITFYASFNAANGNGLTSGDIIYVSETTINQSTVGVLEDVTASMVSIYPNPVESYLNFEVPESFNIGLIQIFNNSGQLIRSISENEAGSKIEVVELPEGLYFLRLSSEKYVVTKKFLKK